ncbi:lipopolysaccharide biosynthesis protein [Sphingobacterium yanglingense]|uniref:O-antigen/teichoic acid export membrane protein n=1 Tax=Sphingobacterium yanglingense TaxID=1437280 RepID=A0A4R6WEF4_9SPHI|nr:lipopolysaccharide biosynthesis protein [Sphingobacterium yanglingense]TDQ76393.1 O-antigen/teichoic acid export membrane protein [Sphingobacterium yanglingense]
MTLKEKTISGVIWSVGQQFGSKLISFSITIVLARILTPAEFGLIAMLSVFISIGNTLLDSGLTSSLIRTTDADQKDFSTVFYFNLIGSTILYFILYFCAPLISSFYHQQVLTSIIRVYSLIFILNAFFGVQNTRLVKEMRFKTQTNIQIPSSLAGGILGIILAKTGYGVWSLVWMSLFTTFLSTILHWIYSDWRPVLIFDKTSFNRHFHFGYKMTLSGVLDTLYQNIYTLIIGKFYSATQLGYYSRADSISQLPTANISAAVNKVTYPMFSEISHNNVQLKRVNKKVMQQVIFWNAPILIFMSATAQPLFSFLLTDKWLPAVPYFQILCIAGVMQPLHAYNLNILKVKGRSDLFLKLEVIKKALSVIGILSVIPFGIYGLLYFQLSFNFIGFYINTIYSGKMINYPVKEQIFDILPTIILSLFIGISTYLLDSFLVDSFNINNLTRIIISALFYALTYLSISNLINLTAIKDFKQLILKR